MGSKAPDVNRQLLCLAWDCCFQTCSLPGFRDRPLLSFILSFYLHFILGPERVKEVLVRGTIYWPTDRFTIACHRDSGDGAQPAKDALVSLGTLQLSGWQGLSQSER